MSLARNPSGNWRPRLDRRGLARLLPAPGHWSADDYLWLTQDANRLIELADGWIEELPMPTQRHQGILAQLFLLLRPVIAARGGRVYFAPLRLRLGERRFREPDLLALLDADDPRAGDDYWRGADLVVEILSPGNADHDLVTKRAEYAEAGIQEYWIVDPDEATIVVLGLEAGAYHEQGRYGHGQSVMSPLLPELRVAATEILSAG